MPGGRQVLFLAAMAATIAAAGCTMSEYGASTVYSSSAGKQIDVVMHPGAPSISQQFRVSSKTVAEGGPSSPHEGIDIVARVGTPVIAAAPGRVARSFSEPMYGNQIVIDHGTDSTGKRTFTLYKHLAKRLAGAGEEVARGQQIGTMGRTGVLAGGISHLHFEVHREIRPGAALPADPHLFWADGVGRVTCLDSLTVFDEKNFRTTYPVICRTR